MKNKFIVLCSAALLTVAGFGCVTATTPPAVVTTNAAGQSVTNQPATVYAVSTNLTGYQAEAQMAAAAASPLLALTPAAPVAPFLPTLLAGIFGLTTVISGAIAAVKNNQNNANQSAAAALASAVYNNPAAVQTATASAQLNGSTQAVAQHLTNAASPV